MSGSAQRNPPYVYSTHFTVGAGGYSGDEYHSRELHQTFGYFALQLFDQLPVTQITRTVQQQCFDAIFFLSRPVTVGSPKYKTLFSSRAVIIEQQMRRVVSPLWSSSVV